MNKFKDIFLHSKKKYIILIIICLFIIIPYLLFRGFSHLINYHDAFFLTGALMVCFGGLSIVNYFGLFDIFGYSSYYVASFIRKKEPVSKYNDFYDYIEVKKERKVAKRYSFAPYILVGLVLIIISAIVLFFI